MARTGRRQFCTHEPKEPIATCAGFEPATFNLPIFSRAYSATLPTGYRQINQVYAATWHNLRFTLQLYSHLPN